MDDFPSNSKLTREPKESTKEVIEKDTSGRPRIEKITTGEVKTRKRGLGRRIAETFTGDDLQTVGSYVLFDVVIPNAKSLLSDIVSEGVERLLFGESRRRPSSFRQTGRASGYTNYSARYTREPERRSDDRPSYGSISRRARATHDFSEVIVETRVEAEEVIDTLGALIEQYGVATVSDLYELVGISGEYTDRKYGWTSPRDMAVHRDRHGYALILPTPVVVD